MYGSRFEKLAKKLLRGPVIAKNMQYFNKSPKLSKPTPPHQDGYYFMIQPCEAITMWLALDHINEQNGCIRYVRGSHLKGLRAHNFSNILGFSQTITDYGQPCDLDEEIAVRANPGDLFIHNAKTIHLADANTSLDCNRRSIGFIYYSTRAKENLMAHQNYQNNLTNKLVKLGRI